MQTSASDPQVNANASALAQCLSASRYATEQVGFTWPSNDQFITAVGRELIEFQREATRRPISQKCLAEELGDILLSTVRLADQFGISPEHALRGATRRFQDRMEQMQRLCPYPLKGLPFEEIAYWYQKAKGSLAED